MTRGWYRRRWLRMPTIKTPRTRVTPGQPCCSLFRMWRTENPPALKPATPCVRWAAAEWDWAWAGEEAAEDLAAEAAAREVVGAVRRREDQEDREGRGRGQAGCDAQKWRTE